MRPLSTLAAAAAVSATALGAAHAIAGEAAEVYPFQEATLTYKLSGAQNGTRIEVIRDHGRETASFMDFSVSFEGNRQQIRTGSWGTKEWVYTYDYGTQEGSKIANPLLEEIAGIENPQAEYTQFMINAGGQQVGADTHNGTKCTVWKIAEATTCVSDDLVMQYNRIAAPGFNLTVELVSQEFGPVDASRFTKPQADYPEVTPPPGFQPN